jgi:bifunctional DNase/RNase
MATVRMELARIIISEVNDHQVVYLREVDSDDDQAPRTFPILIGLFEASMIKQRVQGLNAPRPLTHDLVVKVVEQMGGELQEVLISELREHTYYARLRIRRNGEIVEVDSRPSDALAVAVTQRPPLPIYVAEEVLDEVS